jgi:hypothetical protein
MTTPDRLVELTAPVVRDATRAYLKTRNAQAFERAMQEALARAHAAAYVRGTADRTGVMPKGLSRAERADIAARLKEQAAFLRGFTQAAPGLSDAQVAQRAALYLGATRATYYGARYPGLGIYPGDGGTACKGNCKCSLEERDDGVWWVLGAAEHCDGCRARAADSPYQRERA